MENKRNIIIAGVPRAGKTTVCSYLAKTLKFQHIAMDAIIISLEKAFPETGVKHTDCWDFISTSKKWINFIKELTVNCNYDKLDYKIVFDMYHITPKDYIENINKETCDIYFLGYPNISIEDKFKQIRRFDTKYDWTSKTDDNIVKKHIHDYIEISKWLQSECEKYKIPFIDVSTERDEKLKNLVRKIIEK